MILATIWDRSNPARRRSGTAKVNDYCHVAAWEHAGLDKAPIRNVEPLVFENVKLAERSYK